MGKSAKRKPAELLQTLRCEEEKIRSEGDERIFCPLDQLFLSCGHGQRSGMLHANTQVASVRLHKEAVKIPPPPVCVEEGGAKGWPCVPLGWEDAPDQSYM